MNIAFFGHNSFAAQDLIISLKKKYKTYIFSRRENKKSIFYFDLNKKNLKIKKSNKLNKIDYLFFFSSFVPLNENKSTWAQCKSTNVDGLISLLKNLYVPVNKIILASSCSLYDPKEELNDEESFLKPFSGYSLSKFMQENILRVYCYKKNIMFLTYRLGYVYGNKINDKRLVKKILLNYKKNKKINIYNSSLNLNLIHTKDISNLILKTFKKAEGTFNLTDKNKVTLGNFCQILKGKKVKTFKKKNNYSPKKFFNKFPYLKVPKLENRINDFINGN